MVDETRLHVMIDEDTVQTRIDELAQEISRDYAGKELMLVCILKGGVMFLVQLARKLQVPVTLEFMKVSSYGSGTTSSGTVTIEQDLDVDIKGKHVLIVEDIVDTGRTLYQLRKMLKEREPASLAICALLDKPQMRVSPVIIEYTGFVIEDKFIVGYGLDIDQQYRNLPYIAYIE